MREMLRELVETAEKIHPSTYCNHCDGAADSPCVCEQIARHIIYFELAIGKAKQLLEE